MLMDIEETRAIVRQDQGERLEDILSRWHWWRSGYRAERGVGGGGNLTSEYQTPASYLDAADADEAVDARIEENTMRKVDFEVEQLPALQQYAIKDLARTLCIGVASFRNPRIPAEQRDSITLLARAALTVRLLAAGVLTG